MPLVITPEIIASFRLSKRAFTDTTVWPDDIITEAICEADAETGGRGWGAYEDLCSNFKLRGMYLYAAHLLSNTYITGTAENPANISPTARLNVAAKSVADESVTFRVGAIQSTQDDWLSLTDYGVQYLRLRRRAAMGARVV